MDAFGLQNALVVDPGYLGNLDGSEGGSETAMKVGKRSSKYAAMGSDKWVNLDKVYTNTRPLADVIRGLKAEGYKVYTTSLEGGTDVRDFPFVRPASSPEAPSPPSKTVICFGNEDTGASLELKSLSDGLFYLPMFGFAESYNLSVATSLACAYLLQRGVIRPRMEDEEEVRRREEEAIYYVAPWILMALTPALSFATFGVRSSRSQGKRLMLDWMVKTMDGRGAGVGILKRAGIDVTVND